MAFVLKQVFSFVALAVSVHDKPSTIYAKVQHWKREGFTSMHLIINGNKYPERRLKLLDLCDLNRQWCYWLSKVVCITRKKKTVIFFYYHISKFIMLTNCACFKWCTHSQSLKTMKSCAVISLKCWSVLQLFT